MANDIEIIEVKIPLPPPCPECGARGLHGCPGKPSPGVIYIGVFGDIPGPSPFKSIHDYQQQLEGKRKRKKGE